MGRGYTASSVVGGWAVPYVGEYFCVLWEMNLFFLFLLIYRPSTGWVGVPPSPLLAALTPLPFTTVRTAALPYCCPVLSFFFCKTYIQRMMPLLPYVLLLHCRTALLLFCSFSTCLIQRMIEHQFVFVRHTGRQQAYFASTTSIYIKLTITIKIRSDD